MKTKANLLVAGMLPATGASTLASVLYVDVKSANPTLPCPGSLWGGETKPDAFTLIELLVVIAVIGILAALLLPVLSKTKQKAQGVLCLNSGKQMMFAMTLYGGDNNDFFPPNPDDGNKVPGHNWCGGNAAIGGPNEFDPDILKDPSRSLLITYISRDVSLFHAQETSGWGCIKVRIQRSRAKLCRRQEHFR